MLDYFGDIFYLKSNTQVQDIWQSIRECFIGTECCCYLTESPQQRLCVNDTKQNFILEWSCPNDRQSWFEFKYVGSYQSQNVSIRIVFDNKIAGEQNAQTHYLMFEEKNNGDGAPIFFRQFLKRIGKWALDKYYDTQIINDTDGVLFFPFLIGEAGIAVTKKIAEDSFEHNDEFAKIVKQSKHLFQKMWQNKQNVKVIFYNDSSETELVKNEIKAFRSSMWHVAADFIYCGKIRDSLLPIFFDERLLECDMRIPRGREGRQVLNNLKQRMFKSVRDEIQAKAKIMIYSGNCRLLKEYDNMDDFKADFFKNFECNISDTESKIKSLLPDYFEYQNKDEAEINQRVELRLKEIGADILAEKCRQLDADNAQKDKIITELTNRITALESNSRQSDSETKKSSEENNHPSAKPTISDNQHNIYKDDINDLKNENHQLKKRIEQLQQEIDKKGTEKFEADKGYYLYIPCDEPELFRHEIEDFGYSLFYKKCEEELQNCPANRDDESTRKKDILNSILSSKTFDLEGSETNQKIKRIEKILRDSKNGADIEKLNKEGFEIRHKMSDHPACIYYKRYKITFSLTPNGNVVGSQMKEIKGRFFLTVS